MPSPRLPVVVPFQVLPAVERVRAVLLHPCPQNRKQGMFGLSQADGMVSYHTPLGPRSEPAGLLALTAYDDPAASQVFSLGAQTNLVVNVRGVGGGGVANGIFVAEILACRFRANIAPNFAGAMRNKLTAKFSNVVSSTIASC